MSAPTLADTWYSRGNALFPDSTTATAVANSWLYMLKASLLGTINDINVSGTTVGSRPTGSYWTMQGSSNGTTFSYNGTDNLGTQFTSSNYVHAASGSNHSWFTLRSPTQLGPVYFTVDMNSATVTSAGFIFSRTAPFNTGSLIGRPVSLFEWAMGLSTAPVATTTIAFTADQTTAVNHRAHFATNVSGAFHFATSRDTTGLFYHYSFCTNAVDTETGDLHPTWTGFHQSTTTPGAGAWATLAGTTGITGRTYNSGSASGGAAGVWTFGGTALAGAVTSDVVTGQFRVFPVFLYCVLAANQGNRGRLQDIFVIGNATVGGSVPSAASPQFHVVGTVLSPFGVVPTL